MAGRMCCRGAMSSATLVLFLVLLAPSSTPAARLPGSGHMQELLVHDAVTFDSSDTMASMGEAAGIMSMWDDDEDDGPDDVDNRRMMEMAARTDDEEFCHEPEYRKRTLKLVKEIPFIGLFRELKSQRRFEASGMTFAKGAYWVVFDSLRSIGKVDLQLTFRGENNVLVGEAGEESQFEGLSYVEKTDTFLVVRESFEDEEKQRLVPQVEELKMAKDLSSYEVIRKCLVHFHLEDVNKGFEAMHYFERDGEHHLLGLCESNFCKTIHGHDAPGLRRGNGRLIAAKFHAATKDEDCHWDVVKNITIPETAYFTDYSGISFNEMMGNRVAITSQEDAAVWVGSFDWEEMEFKERKGKVYHFPRDAHCNKIYCNVEGLEFIDKERLAFTSDKAKSTQSYLCSDKDQSIHIFGLPGAAKF